jgi:hypothetical protein
LPCRKNTLQWKWRRPKPEVIAPAVCEKIPVVTCDEKFGLYKELKIFW